jgi:hypothetical protein
MKTCKKMFVKWDGKLVLEFKTGDAKVDSRTAFRVSSLHCCFALPLGRFFRYRIMEFIDQGVFNMKLTDVSKQGAIPIIRKN